MPPPKANPDPNAALEAAAPPSAANPPPPPKAALEEFWDSAANPPPPPPPAFANAAPKVGTVLLGGLATGGWEAWVVPKEPPKADCGCATWPNPKPLADAPDSMLPSCGGCPNPGVALTPNAGEFMLFPTCAGCPNTGAAGGAPAE